MVGTQPRWTLLSLPRRLSCRYSMALLGAALIWLASIHGALASVDQQWKQGVAAFKTYQFQKAIPLFNQVLVTPPASWSAAQKAKAYLYLSLCHYNLGQVSRAEQIFKRAHSLSPKVPLPANMPESVRKSYGDWRKQWDKAPPRRRPVVRRPVVRRPVTRPPPRRVERRAPPRRAPARRVVRRTPAARPLPKSGFRHTASVVILGVAAAALGGGIIAGVMYQQQNAAKLAIEEQKEDADAKELSDAFEQARGTGLVATVLIIAAGVGIAVGLAVLGVEFATKPAPRKQAAVTPTRTDALSAAKLGAWSMP